MEWSEVLADPSLQDLPYKIETDEYGNIVMSPASNEHGYYQVEIAAELRSRGAGRTIAEGSVLTSKGIKVADVVWCSPDFAASHTGENPFSRSPELCVEIASPSNSRAEINEKRSLYFEAGAREFWECNPKGELSFYSQQGSMNDSILFPGFPKKLD